MKLYNCIPSMNAVISGAVKRPADYVPGEPFDQFVRRSCCWATIRQELDADEHTPIALQRTIIPVAGPTLASMSPDEQMAGADMTFVALVGEREIYLNSEATRWAY